MASEEQLSFNEAHAPEGERVFAAFNNTLSDIKKAIVHSRKLWAGQDAGGLLQMWGRAKDLSDHDLLNFTIEEDLKLVRSATASYGIVVLGKIRIPAVDDGYIHVRIHDSPGSGTENVKYHSLFTDEQRGENDHYTALQAIQHWHTPLEFFNE